MRSITLLVVTIKTKHIIILLILIEFCAFALLVYSERQMERLDVMFNVSARDWYDALSCLTVSFIATLPICSLLLGLAVKRIPEFKHKSPIFKTTLVATLVAIVYVGSYVLLNSKGYPY